MQGDVRVGAAPGAAPGPLHPKAESAPLGAPLGDTLFHGEKLAFTGLIQNLALRKQLLTSACGTSPQVSPLNYTWTWTPSWEVGDKRVPHPGSGAPFPEVWGMSGSPSKVRALGTSGPAPSCRHSACELESHFPRLCEEGSRAGYLPARSALSSRGDLSEGSHPPAPAKAQK